MDTVIVLEIDETKIIKAMMEVIENGNIHYSEALEGFFDMDEEDIIEAFESLKIKINQIEN